MKVNTTDGLWGDDKPKTETTSDAIAVKQDVVVVTPPVDAKRLEALEKAYKVLAALDDVGIGYEYEIWREDRKKALEAFNGL